MHDCGKDYLIFLPFRLPQISCFSSDSDNCPDMGMRPLFQFPHWPRAGLVLLTLLFSPLVPLSYRVLPGFIYSFPLVMYSCLLSDGVLHALLCLKVCSWCNRGEMYSTSTPPPSFSPLDLIFTKCKQLFLYCSFPKVPCLFVCLFNLRHSLLLNYLFTTMYINSYRGRRSADLFSLSAQKPWW